MWSIYEIIHIWTAVAPVSRRSRLRIPLKPSPVPEFSFLRAPYRGGKKGEFRGWTSWSPDFFRLLLSNCLSWKIYCDDHSSLSVIVLSFWLKIWKFSFFFDLVEIVVTAGRLPANIDKILCSDFYRLDECELPFGQQLSLNAIVADSTNESISQHVFECCSELAMLWKPSES